MWGHRSFGLSSSLIWDLSIPVSHLHSSHQGHHILASPTPWQRWIVQRWHVAHAVPFLPSSRSLGLSPEKMHRSPPLWAPGGWGSHISKGGGSCQQPWHSWPTEKQRQRRGESDGSGGPCRWNVVPASLSPSHHVTLLDTRSCMIRRRRICQKSVHCHTCGWQGYTVGALGNCEAGEYFIIWDFFFQFFKNRFFKKFNSPKVNLPSGQFTEFAKICSYQNLASRNIFLELIPCHSILRHVQVKETKGLRLAWSFPEI